MRELALAFQRAPIVLLTGPPGVGKTDLACEFARRRANSGDYQGDVIYTAFDYGPSLGRVTHEIGSTLRGISFARLSPAQQRQWTVDYFRQNPSLLVWDNFEDVFQYLDQDECEELVNFLKDVAGGDSHVLITGRARDWTVHSGIEYGHQELGGLQKTATRALAGVILDGAGVEASVTGPEHQELLELLKGNPMAMRVVLPHLKQHSPSELAQAIRGWGQGEIGETEVPAAALECSFSLLSPRTRTHLPFLALFRQRVLLDVLTFFTQGEAYRSVMGEELGWGACRTFLKEARDRGILDAVSPSVYLIRPSISGFLGQKLGLLLTESLISILEEEFVRVYAGLGDYFLEKLSSEEAESTVTGVLAEEWSLLRALRLAEEREQWDSAQLILQPLGQVYKMQQRVVELRSLRGELLARIGTDAERAEQVGAIGLWLYLQGSEMGEAVGRMELDRAEKVSYAMLRHLESSSGLSPQPQLATVYHHLGQISQARSEYEQAQGWYERALEVLEASGTEAECADNYHQLGLLAQSQHQYERAESWHRRALEIRQRLEDQHELAGECHQLALVAEASHQFEDALGWYSKAGQAYEDSEDKAGAATIYHRLGLIAQARYDYEEATGWYQRSLLAYEELGEDANGASDHYQLGMIALHRYEYGEAQEWLRQALEAYERLENEPGMADAYHQLGYAYHAQGTHQEAEVHYQKALEIFVRLGDEVAAASTWGQLGVLAEQRGNYPHAVWYVAHTYEISIAHQLDLVSEAMKHLYDLRAKLGTEAFLRCWQEVSDTDILPELVS